MSKSKSILIFGGSELQRSIIEKSKTLGLRTIVVDPDPNASSRNIADVFVVVGGKDIEGTCAVVENHKIEGIITAATDKPLVMMAMIAERYNLPFFSVETAVNSTDKYLMKQKFIEHNIPHASGILVSRETKLDDIDLPVVIKPRDNSGSRGVILCTTTSELHFALSEAFTYTTKDSVLCECFIEGKEYSIEAIHYNKKTHLVAITEKATTPFPYNVELAHIQPAAVDEAMQLKIEQLIENIAVCLNFDNCASHTEIKISGGLITVIETSPRLGGDFITSKLIPLSSGFDIEKALIEVATNNTPTEKISFNKASGIFYFDFPEGLPVKRELTFAKQDNPEIVDFNYNLSVGDCVPKIRNSLDRYGYVIFSCVNREALFKAKELFFARINVT
jgi:carbamoyl-phosphate synthase large subunit